MARSEYAKASIGIKILLSDLIQQINKDNWNLIKEMLENGFIEDENEYFNDVYQKIQNSDQISGNWKKSKKFISDDNNAPLQTPSELMQNINDLSNS